jgi:hypothetical protein
MTNVNNIADMDKEDIVTSTQEFVLTVGTETMSAMLEYANVLVHGNEFESTYLEGYMDGINTVIELYLEAFKVVDNQEVQANDRVDSLIQVLNRGYKQ